MCSPVPWKAGGAPHPRKECKESYKESWKGNEWIMAVRNMVRELSYGQSGVSSYEYGCGSGRIGVTENQDCQGAH